MKTLSIEVNGQAVTAEVEPRLSLADFLRERAGTKSVHLGCEHGVCGACTVVLDGEIARSCIALAIDCDGAQVTTLEGLEGDALTERLRTSFHEEHGLQCGFCTPGMLITARDTIQRGQAGDTQSVRHAFAANICRCTGYAGIIRAVCKTATACACDVQKKE